MGRELYQIRSLLHGNGRAICGQAIEESGAKARLWKNEARLYNMQVSKPSDTTAASCLSVWRLTYFDTDAED